MTVLTLKQLAYKRVENPAFYKRLKSLGRCPYDLVEPILKQMTYFQLLILEENTTRLANYTQPVWKMHTLKVFPTIVDTHDIDGADAEDADWRLVFHELQEERKEREQAARDRLKANYSQIASGKSDRKIQVIKKTVPTNSQVRASLTRSSLGSPVRNPSSIMNKAVKASINSTSRQLPKQTQTTLPGHAIRPNPNSSRTGSQPASALPAKRSLPTVKLLPLTSRFLTTSRKK